jgi:hypothetical protein
MSRLMDAEQHYSDEQATKDGFAGGFNDAFEARFRTAIVAGRWVLVAVVAMALSGLFGHGPFSHSTKQSKSGLFSVNFEPVARSGADTSVTVHLHPAAQQAAVALSVNSAFLEPMGLSGIEPKPVAEAAAPGGGMVLHFGVSPADRDALIRFDLQPGAIGPVTLKIQLLDEAATRAGDAVQWTEFVLP